MVAYRVAALPASSGHPQTSKAVRVEAPKRSKGARLTEQGDEILAEADARSQTIDDRMTAGLDEQQRRQLIELLQHCAEALESALDEPHEAQEPEPDT